MVIVNLVKFPEKGGKLPSMNSHHGSLGMFILFPAFAGMLKTKTQINYT